MQVYFLNIAGYGIRIESSGPDLVPGNRFRNFVVPALKGEYDLRLAVEEGSTELPAGSVRVFHAPYVGENNEIRIEKDPEFWSVWKNDDNLYIKTLFHAPAALKSSLMKFSLRSAEWELRIQSEGKPVDPLEYPMDGLMLYYLTVRQGDIMIHASAVNHNGRGYLFSGISGKGKSTMAGIWEKAGAVVIHDDRIIIRRSGDSYLMHNTPVYENDEPRLSVLSKIFLIRHGLQNEISPVYGADAVSLVMANCIQHNWRHDIISVLLNSVSQLCMFVPVARLAFIPDSTVIDQIMSNEQS